MRRNSWSVLLLLSSVLSGCSQSILVTPPRTGAEAAPSEPTTEERIWKSHYLLGFVGRSHVDLRDHCSGGNVVSISVGQNALTILLWLVTVGIYTPQRVSIRCAAAPSPRGDGS